MEGQPVFSPWMDQAACRGQEHLFDNAALEWDPRSSAARALASSERATQQAAYDDAVKACQQVCSDCSVLSQCRDWVEATPLRVYGVVGGLAPEDRPHDTDIATRVPGDLTAAPIDTELVLSLHRKGIPASTIAKELGHRDRSIRRIITQHTLTKATESTHADMPCYPALTLPIDHSSSEYLLIEVPRTVIAVPHPDHPHSFPSCPSEELLRSLPVATRPLQAESASGIAAAILDVLADGQPHSREELLAAATAAIPEELALREWAVGVSTATETPARRIMRASTTQVPHGERVARGAHRRASSYLAWMERTRGWVQHRTDGYVAAGDTLRSWHEHRATTAPLRMKVPA